MKINKTFVPFLPAMFAIALVSALPTHARASIAGFGDFSGFTVNQIDSGAAPTLSGGTINLTSGTPNYGEVRSIFYDIPQSISGDFTASFTYTATGVNNSTNGACFVLQNSTAGPSAVGSASFFDFGDYFGYLDFPGPSVAVTLEGENYSGYYVGSYGGGSPSISPVNLFSGDPIDVTLSYNGSTLQESLVDTTTQAEYGGTFLIETPLPTVLDGSTAYVGLAAASDSDNGTAYQYFSNFEFTNGVPAVPEPSSLALLGMGAGALCLVYRRRR